METVPGVYTRRLLALAGATGYVVAIAFVWVFPMYTPFSGLFHYLQLGLTVLLALGLVALARFSRYPLLPILGLFLVAIAGLELIKVCLGVGCRIPPGYEPWRSLKWALEWGFLGPRLALTSRPEPCAFACPHRIELLPLVLGYAAIWVGAAEPTVYRP